MSAKVIVQNLSKVYEIKKKSIIALDDVSFELEPNEVIALVGESGSGKTTLANILLGTLKQTSGSVFVPRRKSLVLQDSYRSLCPYYTMRASLIEALKLDKSQSMDQNFDASIERHLQEVGMSYEAIKHKLPHELSGGQLQRISLVRATLLHPEFVVMDEPTSMLDRINTQRVAGIIKHISKNATVLIVTHDIEFAKNVSDKMLVLEKGKIVDSFDTDALYANERHEYTKALTLASLDLERYIKE